ncbi:hypothetical protein CASFOL_019386 [Castilleja foliolosa]|uniref:PORR domain-containing protein n=1 Tax=Castilleja foliolosa TaxID=1961234 RepID=A0ABD3D5W1_9LAMI
MRILQKLTTTVHSPFAGGPFTASIQTRFRKPADTAQTRIETRTRDPKLDLIAFHRRRLALVLSLHSLVSSRKRGPFVSVQLLSKWAPHAGLNTLTAGEFLSKYPHVFEVFTHPVRKNSCCKFTSKFLKLLELEDQTVCNMEDVNVIKLKKIMSMSVNGRVHLHAIRLMRRELGLPENFRDSIIQKHTETFRMIDWEIVELVDWNENECTSKFSAEIEKWRLKEYNEKWLSEFEVKYAFPINFPTGFKIVPGFKEKLRNWQRLSYVKPYERVERVRARSCGGPKRYEKRAVGIIHELLWLTVEKMVDIERLAHFRKDLGIEVNLREVVLKHPGIFYVSTRGNDQMVFLREAYSKGCLVETESSIYDVRREMLELILLCCRNTRERMEEIEACGDGKLIGNCENGGDGVKDGDFVIPILESYKDSGLL